MIEVHILVVPPDDAVFPGKKINSRAKIPGIGRLTKNPGVSQVGLKRPGYQHHRSLDLKSVVENSANSSRVCPSEVVQPPEVGLAFQGVAFVFDATVKGRHSVANI